MTANGHDVRPYKVFVRKGADAYREVWEGDARNSEHAARQAMKDNPTLKVDEVITVPVKMWTPVPVKRQIRETITVG